MEEKAFSSEQSEDVIELLDIVESAGEESSAESGEDSPAILPMEAEKASAEPLKNIAPGQEEGEKSPCHGEEFPPENGGDTAEHGLFSEQEAPQQKQSVSAGASSCTCEECDTPAAFEERLCALEERSRTAILALEERIVALEKTCAVLAENVETLSQQLAHAGSMFMGDASVRLDMEEMVSHMLDVRLPQPSEQKEDNSSGQEALALRVEDLERRIDEWHTHSEQMAALAAAKVIREEIAAMKAEGVPLGI